MRTLTGTSLCRRCLNIYRDQNLQVLKVSFAGWMTAIAVDLHSALRALTARAAITRTVWNWTTTRRVLAFLHIFIVSHH